MTQLMQRLVHVRFTGRSEEVSLADLGLTNNVTDMQLKTALVSYFDVPTHFLMNHVVVRTEQAIIVRPQAVYG